MNNTQYENEYGKLVVEPITDYRPVSSIKGADVPADCMFDLVTLEQIVLITGNRQSQGVFITPERCYLVVHESCSSACVVRVVSLEYTGPGAAQEIDRLRPRHPSTSFLK
jgi:hypothetical protein